MRWGATLLLMSGVVARWGVGAGVQGPPPQAEELDDRVVRKTSQAPSLCAGRTACAEVATFAATVTGFETTVQEGAELVTATVRFQNKTNRPLLLGYVHASGIATDDRGRRYLASGEKSVGGIGVIGAGDLDPGFVLQPGATGAVRFEFVSDLAGRQVLGGVFEIDLTVREIEQVAAGRFRLGREHDLRFRTLGTARSAVPTPPAQSGRN
jgi:hypothetical protein